MSLSPELDEADQPQTSGRRTGRSFYAAPVSEFRITDDDAIIGRLSSRHVAFHAAAEAEQLRAWKREIEILKESFAKLGSLCDDWQLLLEIPLLRLGKRIDAVVLAPGVVGVIEFKINATAFQSADRVQTERYAQSLSDFHEASQQRLILPILCAERARAKPPSTTLVEGVGTLMEANATTLADALLIVQSHVDPNAAAIDAHGFDYSPYRPTPNIVEAAQALYAGHEIADIGRGDAADAELQAAAAALQEIAADAEASRAKVVCFVTGAPGAGKTLLGLDLALKSRSGTRPAALLSGNRPLVHVLTEALAEDSAARGAMTKTEARRFADAAIQNLLGYLKEHTDGAPPPEHVIVFDEAQRAWDAEVGKELMGRPSSEPELFLEILDRLDWACLVCLVGPGQEINRGEGGLALWGEALRSAQSAGSRWCVVAAPQALDGGPDVPGSGMFVEAGLGGVEVRREPALHLSNAIRAYRNPLHAQWVARLLDGDIAEAKALAARMDAPPALMTRDLAVAKEWLRQRRRGGRTVGLLASSGAVRLVGEGVPPSPRSNELNPIGHWFLKPFTDFRSAGALETPMSEFGCQGLELDYACLCWGGDLIWNDQGWLPRMMRAPRWQIARDTEKQRFRLNGYRVLLTRARAGLVLFVPRGEADDPTRSPDEMDACADALIAAGCAELTQN
ncbi:DNA/RNA helicase domain-containing protein [Paracoccus pacificus]|uniref:DNA/RNA helicase domain-containing protein n=2 Tax=Paracoccaceae TaxID=31989 RepID=A0ABW4RBS7_9RHOB